MFDDLADFKFSLEEKIDSLEDNTVSRDLFDDDREKLYSLYDELESGTKEFKDLMDKRISYFEDTWSDPNKTLKLYESAIRPEVDSFKSEIMSNIQGQVNEIESNLSIWKDGNLSLLLEQLKEAKENIDSFIESSKDKKNGIIAKMIASIKEEILGKESEINTRLEEKLSTVNDRIANLEERLTSEEYGFAMKKGNTELVQKVNDALKTLKENGEYDKIYEKWLGKKPQASQQ